VPQDDAKAVGWWRKAADQGDATAQYYLGRAYRRGEGVSPNYSEAARWYRKAAEQGDTAAQRYLARVYRRGEGVPQDYVESYRWSVKRAGPIAMACIRRLGWTGLIALVLVLAGLVPQGRLGCAPWLRWVLMSGGCWAYLIHVVLGTFWRGGWRVGIIAILAGLSILCASFAVMARRDSRGNRAHA
jgi:hypothetical protein